MKHYCVGHKTHLDIDEWLWHEFKDKGQTKYYCNKCIECVGCKEIHPLGKNGGAKGFGDPMKWICYKWSKPSAKPMSKRIMDMSPEDVMSGVHLGNERASYFEKDTNDWGSEHKKQKEDLGNALAEV